jgi:hypothetical protein
LDSLQRRQVDQIQLSDWNGLRRVIQEIRRGSTSLNIEALRTLYQVVEQPVFGELSWLEKITGARLTHERRQKIAASIAQLRQCVDADEQLSDLKQALQSDDAKHLALDGPNARIEYLEGLQGQVVEKVLNSVGFRVNPNDGNTMEMEIDGRWLPAPAMIDPDPETDWLRTVRREVGYMPSLDSMNYLELKQDMLESGERVVKGIFGNLVRWHLWARHDDWVKFQAEFIRVLPGWLRSDHFRGEYDEALEYLNELASQAFSSDQLPPVGEFKSSESRLYNSVLTWANGVGSQ